MEKSERTFTHAGFLPPDRRIQGKTRQDFPAGKYNGYRRPRMAGKKRVRKWTYNGIRAYYPDLSFKEWLAVCRSGKNEEPGPEWVVSNVKRLASVER
jgi:hypothetical protein